MSHPLVLIGYDPHEDLSYRVCKESILSHSRRVDVLPIRRAALESVGLYRRPLFRENGQDFDGLDGKPFSTEFSFSRFLAPALARLMDRDLVLFCDSDFLFRAPVEELFDLADDRYSVQVVKHAYRCDEETKMRAGVAQQAYRRKLWSALMLMQVSRCRLTPFQVNTMPGSWLHGFGWLNDADIGSLPMAWHWVQRHSPEDVAAKAVHFTLGTPDVAGYEADKYADEWLSVAWRVDGKEGEE